MKRFKKILVATDTRHDHHPIVEQAAEIAHYNRASLKIVDVVPAFSWFSRRVTEDHELMSELVAKEKKEKLAALAETVRGKGLEVESKVLTGKASVEITREVMLGEHDLVMAVTKGKNSKVDGRFGQTAMRLLRQCPSAVWLVTRESTPKFKHILGCVDTSSDYASDTELNDKVFEIAQSVSKYHDARFSMLHAWDLDDEAILGTRLTPELLGEYVRDERRFREEKFDKFLQQHDSGSNAENVHLVKGETSKVISQFVNNNAVDLLVMGTIGRAGLTGMFIGNTAERILSKIYCSVLALKPNGFKGSIKAN